MAARPPAPAARQRKPAPAELVDDDDADLMAQLEALGRQPGSHTGVASGARTTSGRGKAAAGFIGISGGDDDDEADLMAQLDALDQPPRQQQAAPPRQSQQQLVGPRRVAGPPSSTDDDEDLLRFGGSGGGRGGGDDGGDFDFMDDPDLAAALRGLGDNDIFVERPHQAVTYALGPGKAAVPSAGARAGASALRSGATAVSYGDVNDASVDQVISRDADNDGGADLLGFDNGSGGGVAMEADGEGDDVDDNDDAALLEMLEGLAGPLTSSDVSARDVGATASLSVRAEKNIAGPGNGDASGGHDSIASGRIAQSGLSSSSLRAPLPAQRAAPLPQQRALTGAAAAPFLAASTALLSGGGGGVAGGAGAGGGGALPPLHSARTQSTADSLTSPALHYEARDASSIRGQRQQGNGLSGVGGPAFLKRKMPAAAAPSPAVSSVVMSAEASAMLARYAQLVVGVQVRERGGPF